MGQEKILKPVKSLSGVTSFGESQRAELVARILNRTPKAATASGRPELLSALLKDTANLSQFIRSAGLSEEMAAALLQEAGNADGKPAQLSPRSMGEINDVLARIRPTAAGVDDSYGAAASFGEIGSRPGQPHSPVHEVNNAIDGFPNGRAANLQFVPFSPGQADFDRTIDNIWSGAETGQGPEESPSFAGIPPVQPQRDSIGISSETFYLILLSLAGALLFGIFVFMT